MRNLAIPAAMALALAACSLGTFNSGTNNYKGQPLSAVIARLGWPPDETQTIDGQKVYTWTVGQSVQQCKVRVVMAGDVIDAYEGSGDVNICGQYGALSGGLKGF
jgi:hypothetical protein